MKKVLHWLDSNVENMLVFPLYFIMMLIMAIGVIQRFVFATAWHWAVYVCIGMFVWFSWLGCSWNVKERAHLRLSFFRSKMPRKAQFALQMLDYALWLAFGIIASYYSIFQIIRLHDIGSLIYGTDNVPQWLVPLCIPVSFAVLFIRVIQCVVKDVKDLKSGRPIQIEPSTTVEF